MIAVPGPGHPRQWTPRAERLVAPDAPELAGLMLRDLLADD